MGGLVAIPVSLDEANAFVRDHHRHHQSVIGHKFSIGAVLDEKLVGVAIVGRPVSRHRDDGRTLEVTRLCTDGTRNACSFLYGRAARATIALGYVRIGTYHRADEPGSTARAAGWRLVGETKGASWDRQDRPRHDRTDIVDRHLFEYSSTSESLSINYKRVFSAEESKDIEVRRDELRKRLTAPETGLL